MQFRSKCHWMQQLPRAFCFSCGSTLKSFQVWYMQNHDTMVRSYSLAPLCLAAPSEFTKEMNKKPTSNNILENNLVITKLYYPVELTLNSIKSYWLKHFNVMILLLHSDNTKFNFWNTECHKRNYQGIIPPKAFFPSMASFFAWQLGQRKGPSHGRNFPGSDEPACTEMPSPGFISTWQTAHINSLNKLHKGYCVSNLQCTFTTISFQDVAIKYFCTYVQYTKWTDSYLFNGLKIFIYA